MKAISIASLMLGAALAVPAMAQVMQDGSMKVRAISPEIRRGAPSDIYVMKFEPTQITFRENAQTKEIRTLPPSRFTSFYVFAPDDFEKANQAFADSNYKDARTMFANMKRKYAQTSVIPHSLASTAAYKELVSAMRLMDWSGAKALADQYPVRASELTPEMANEVAVAKIMGLIPDKQWDKILSEAKAIKSLKKNLNLYQLSQLYYAEGLANSAKKNVVQAIQDFSVAAVISHGANREISADAMKNVIDLYMGMDEVKKFIATTPGTTLMANSIAARPYSVRQAAAFYHMYNLMFPNQPLPDSYKVLEKYYINSQLKKAAEAAK